MNNETNSAHEFIAIEEVARLLGGVCTRTVRRLSDADNFPRPVKIGARSVYAKSEVVRYMDRKLRERAQ